MVDILKEIIDALYNISVPLMDISEKLSIDNQAQALLLAPVILEQPITISPHKSKILTRSLQSKPQPKHIKEGEVRIDDIILTHNQFDLLFGKSQRSGISTLSRRWPNNKLPYEIDSSTIATGSAEDNMIKQAVTRFNSDMNGCINIV